LRDGLRRPPTHSSARPRHRAQVAGISTTLAITEEDLPDGAEGAVEETVLLKQHFIKDSSRTIEQLVKEAIAQTGENIRIRRFTRYDLGQ
jgi:elongation factor Ts